MIDGFVAGWKHFWWAIDALPIPTLWAAVGFGFAIVALNLLIEFMFFCLSAIARAIVARVDGGPQS